MNLAVVAAAAAAAAAWMVNPVAAHDCAPPDWVSNGSAYHPLSFMFLLYLVPTFYVMVGFIAVYTIGIVCIWSAEAVYRGVKYVRNQG